MRTRLSLFIAVTLLFIVVAFGFDNVRARNIDSNIDSSTRMSNNAVVPGQYYYRHYYRRHYRHHRHHRRHRRYSYRYYRR